MEIKEKNVITEILATYTWVEEYLGMGCWLSECEELGIKVIGHDRQESRDLAEEAVDTMFAYLIQFDRLENFFISRGMEIPIITIPNCSYKEMIYDATLNFENA